MELAFTNQFSCPSPLLPQYYFIFKPLSWDKTNITTILSLPLVPSLPSASINYIFFQNYNLPTKNIWEICVNKNSRGGKLGLGMGKCQDKVGIQVFYSKFIQAAILWNGGRSWSNPELVMALLCLNLNIFLRQGGDRVVNQNLFKLFNIASIWKIFSSSFFSLNRPTGQIWTSSCDVHISVYMFICPLTM